MTLNKERSPNDQSDLQCNGHLICSSVALFGLQKTAQILYTFVTCNAMAISHAILFSFQKTAQILYTFVMCNAMAISRAILYRLVFRKLLRFYTHF